MMDKEIEFACTHNNGRSPLAEAFAVKYIEDENIMGYKIFSSGTSADNINKFLAGTSSLPNEELRIIVRIGIEKNLISDFKGAEMLLEGVILSPENLEKLTQYSCQTAKILVDEESHYRDIAFDKFGLSIPKVFNRQTIVNSDINLLLCMGRNNIREAKNIYLSSTHKPIIGTLAGYAQRIPGLQFKGVFGGNLSDYLIMAETIRDYTHKSLDRATQEI